MPLPYFNINMGQQIFDYGDYQLDKTSLIDNIKKNLEGYIKYKKYSDEQTEQFMKAAEYISKGIEKGTITKDLQFKPSKPGQFKFVDSEGGLIEGDLIHDDVLRLVDKIAHAQGKDPANEALLRKRKKAEEDAKKVTYGDFEEFFVKSINPKATGMTDPNLDWGSWAEANKGKEGEALASVIKSFIEKGNPDPSTVEALEKAAQGLMDNNISAQDKLNMNRAGWRAPFYNFVFKGVSGSGETPKDPKGGNNGGTPKDGTNPNGDGQPVIPEKLIPTQEDLKRRVANASLATEQGDYYIEGKRANKKQYILWNDEFHEIPITYTDDKGINNIRKLLQKYYKNRYNSENMENQIQNLSNYINTVGKTYEENPQSKSFTFFDFTNPALSEVYYLLRKQGLTSDQIIALINRSHNIPTYTNTTQDVIFSPKRGLEAVLSFGSFKEGGTIIKAQTGTPLTYKADNELYKSLYKEGAQSIGLAGSNNSLRSSNLKFNTKYDKDLDLNTYYKQFNLYSNPDDRHKDFITWANKYYTNTDDIGSLLNRYNDSIDNMYKYKQTDQARTYKDNGNIVESNETATFNTSYNDHYSSANTNIFGYDPNSIKIAGSATMGRHPDITENDIEMDFSKHEITNEGLKKLLTENKLVKAKTGHYIIADPIKDDAEDVVNGKEKGKGSSSIVGDEKYPMPEKEEPITVPQEPSELGVRFPTILANFDTIRRRNDQMQDLHAQKEFPLQDPIQGHRPVYGNLRAIAEANRRGAQRMALTKSLFTSDNAQNMAMLYDTFNMNTNDFIQALQVDDATQKETMEKSLALARENYLYNKNIYWNNKQQLAAKKNSILEGEIGKTKALMDSEVNRNNDISDLLSDSIIKEYADKRGVASKELMSKIEESPISYIDGWDGEHQKLWDTYKRGETITNPKDKELISFIQTQIQAAYLRGLYPNDVMASKPSMRNFRSGVPYAPIVGVSEEKKAEQGKRGMRLIPYMRKNKY